MSNRDDKKNQGDLPTEDRHLAEKIFGDQVSEENSVSEQPSETILDLGLGSFLQSAADVQDEESQAINSADLAVEADGATKTNTQGNSLSEFEILAQTADWSNLLSQTESLLENQQVRLQSSEKWIEAQAWWIVAQLALNLLPASVLAAPFESMLDQVLGSAGSKDLHEGSSQALKQSNRLLVKRVAAQLIDRLFSQASFTSGIQLASRVRLIGGDLSVLSDLVKKYADQLEALSGSDHKLYTILCKELLISRSNRSETEKILKGLSAATSDKNDINKIQTGFEATRKPTSFARVVLLVLGFFAILAGTIFWLWGNHSAVVPFPSAMNQMSVPTPAFESPKPPPLAKVGELDAVLYGMATKVTSPSLQPSSAQGSAVAQQTQKTSNIVPQATVVAPTPKAKVAVDTKGPVESRGLRDLRDRKQREEKSISVQGSMNNQGTAVIEVPGPAIAPRFENFQQPKVYRIRRATNLMLQPSLNSEPVAGLNKGDRVKVTGMAGYWLKVMSRQGRVAYVLSEDAEILN